MRDIHLWQELAHTHEELARCEALLQHAQAELVFEQVFLSELVSIIPMPTVIRHDNPPTYFWP